MRLFRRRKPEPRPPSAAARELGPFRGTLPRRRFELRVDDTSIEADHFALIIEHMREAGYSDADIIEAARVVIDTPRGGKVETGRAAGLRTRTGMRTGKRLD